MTSDNQVFVSRRRDDCAGLNHHQIILSMIKEAAAAGYEPAEYTEPGHPVVYFRGQYQIDSSQTGQTTETWKDDLFMMPVRRPVEPPVPVEINYDRLAESVVRAFKISDPSLKGVFG